MKRRYAITTMVAAILLCATFASAALVTQWEYTNDAVFVNWVNTEGTQTYTELSPDGRTLEWGVPSWTSQTGLKSAIDINAPITGTDLYTNVNTVDVVSLTHHNYVLSSLYPTLEWGLIAASVEFTPYDPAGGALPVDTAFLEFLFFETPNDSNTPSDIFVLVDPGLTQGSFFYQDYKYNFVFTSTGFSQFDGAYDEYLDAILGEDDYFGWLTEEEAATTVQFKLAISSAPVPEPGTMLLVGSGLLGLAALARRRKN